MMTERLRRLVRQSEELSREGQNAMALVLQRELAAPDPGQRGSMALLRLTRLRADLCRAGFPSVDAVAVLEQSRAEVAQRPAS